MLICYNTSMKNKTLKNLIALSIFAVSIFSVNAAQASLYYDAPVYDANASSYRNNSYYSPRQQIVEQQLNFQQRQLQLEAQASQQQYYNDQQKIVQDYNLALQKQALATNTAYSGATYTAQPVLVQPTTTYAPQQQTVQYAPKQQINYVPASAQGASAYNSVASKKVATNATGQYVNYDPNMQAASAYGYSNGQTPVQAYDPNGVTALSMNGSGGFMPSSVFQWFMLILLILAIIIVARMIIRKRAANNAHAVPAH